MDETEKDYHHDSGEDKKKEKQGGDGRRIVKVEIFSGWRIRRSIRFIPKGYAIIKFLS